MTHVEFVEAYRSGAIRILIKRSAPNFVITHALEDAKFFDDAAASGLLQIHSA